MAGAWRPGGRGGHWPDRPTRRLGASRLFYPLLPPCSRPIPGHSGEVRERAHLVERLVCVLVGQAVRWLPTTLAALQPEQRSLEGPEAPAWG